MRGMYDMSEKDWMHEVALNENRKRREKMTFGERFKEDHPKLAKIFGKV